MDVKNIETKYRPIPFWSWNEKMQSEETAQQVRLMKDVGIGGFFMHARGGLQTEYMSDEWFNNVETAVSEAEKLGMRPWAYDENGWPSGFGNGIVNGMGVEYQQKYLRMENSLNHTENSICKCGEHYFYYETNPFYVDTLDKKVVSAFVKCAYEPYYKKFGNRIEGFFTDEPQISRNGIPWSFVFRDEYNARYGEDLLEHLEELFLSVGDYKNTRIKFWKMVTDLFSSAYFKQIYEWCDDRGLKLTGHLALEETLGMQIVSNGACMPHYEYFHIPGMDWLGRDIEDCLTIKQVASAAEQLGKETVLTETFALCGHNVSFSELKGIYEWQMVRGINLLCQHLEGYSIRGIRKRDYPPAMYKQQPWWDEYDKWINAVSRIGKIITEGEVKTEVLLIHPQTTVWTLFDGQENEKIYELDKKFFKAIKNLEQKHIGFHLGDETILERHAKVENGKIIVGKYEYCYVIDECCSEYLPTTKALLDEYKRQGGKFVLSGEIEENNVTDRKDITYTVRYFDNLKVHYFVNTSPEEKKARINIEGKKLDIYSGELCDFSGEHIFEPWGSLVIYEDGSENIKLNESEENFVNLNGKFRFVENPVNALTIDKCDYYFDGILQEKDGYVLNVCERANVLERKVKIRMDFKMKVEYIPGLTELVCETPEKFNISINGVEIDKTIKGWFVDKSFKRIDISEYVKIGENIISFECDFIQSQNVYDNCKKAWIFESEKNKLCYDMEIESIYVIGDFSVRSEGVWTNLEKDAMHFRGDFIISKPAESIEISNIEQQGFPFFCGEIKVVGEIKICGKNSVLKINKKGINCVKLEVGGYSKTVLTENKILLPPLENGKYKITLTMKNNLRNLLGPHHLERGECTRVCPSDFYKEKCVWKQENSENWNEDYCFVKTGIE